MPKDPPGFAPGWNDPSFKERPPKKKTPWCLIFNIAASLSVAIGVCVAVTNTEDYGLKEGILTGGGLGLVTAWAINYVCSPR